MYNQKSFIKYACLLVFVGLSIQNHFAQVTTPTTFPTPDEVVKIDTKLIQTGVTVFDEKGKLVDSLGKHDFELKVDGKPIAISFFESVYKNSKSDSASKNAKTNDLNEKTTSQLERGRTFLFIVDDLHLAEAGTYQTRILINDFIDNKLNKNDLLAIVSTTGKIGFLQQFSNDKIMLKATVEKIIFSRNYKANDQRQPPMSEYEAMLINRFEPEITNYFVEIAMRENPGTRRENVEAAVRSRASNIVNQSDLFTKQTITVIEQAIRRSAQLSGRKIVFLLSEGFLLDQKSGDLNSRLRRVVDAASRANAVIYGIDMKGLEADMPPLENKTNRTSQRAYRVQSGERFETMDAMSFVAKDTGGKLYTNTNDFRTPLEKATLEASGYYLLAWEPETEIAKTDKLKKIEVTVKGQPKLQVRFQNGYIPQPETNSTQVDPIKQEIPKEKLATETKDKLSLETKDNLPAETQELNNALSSQTSIKDLPTLLAINFLDYPNEGILLTTAVQIKAADLNFQKQTNGSFAEVDLQGEVYDSAGKSVGYFKERVKVNSQSQSNTDTNVPDMFLNKRIKLNPGLYQVRIASREVSTGKLGNANKWITIPDLSSKKLALSTLLIREIERSNETSKSTGSDDQDGESAGISVDRVFSKTSYLSYTIFVYNAAQNASSNAKPEVYIQTQLLQNGNVIMNGASRLIPLEDQDLERLYYSADIPLESLTRGEYEIRVSITDNIAKTSLSKSDTFQIK